MFVQVCAHCHTGFGSILLQWASVHQDDNLDQRGALELWHLSWRTYWAKIAQVSMVARLEIGSKLIDNNAMNNRYRRVVPIVEQSRYSQAIFLKICMKLIQSNNCCILHTVGERT